MLLPLLIEGIIIIIIIVIIIIIIVLLISIIIIIIFLSSWHYQHSCPKLLLGQIKQNISSINLHIPYIDFTGTISDNPPSDTSSTTTKSMQIFCGRFFLSLSLSQAFVLTFCHFLFLKLLFLHFVTFSFSSFCSLIFVAFSSFCSWFFVTFTFFLFHFFLIIIRCLDVLFFNKTLENYRRL